MKPRTLFVLAACMAAGLMAQSPQASISGTVRDQQDAAIPGAAVSATHNDTGVRSAVETNHAGFYSLQALPVGAYTVRVEVKGFQSQLQENIVLTTGQSQALNFTMKVGQVNDSVTVTTEAPLIETRTSEASQLIESKTIEDIPLGDRRAMNVMEMSGAAVFVSYTAGQRPYFSVGGGRGRSQNFVMDGGSGQTIRLGQAQIETDPPVESLQEVRVLTNAFSAEYGGTASGVVVMNTKSGTNRFRGSLFEYFRNEKLDAANFFAPWVDGQKQRAPIRYNVFGGTFSGPIRKNKAFFFGSYEGSRRRDGTTVLMTVPSMLERRGNFSQSFNTNGTLATIYDPASSPTPEGRTAFRDNVIPASRLDSVSMRVIEFYPAPNRTPDNVAGTNNFGANTVDVIDRNTYTAKVDYNLSDADKLTGRLLWQGQDELRRSVYPDAAAEPTGNRDTKSYNILGAWTKIVSASFLNELRVAYLYRSALLYTPSLGLDYPTKLGIRGIPNDAFPRFQLAGYDPLGSNNQLRDQAPIQQYHVLNTVSWITGTHSVRFGGEVRRSRNRDRRLQQVSGLFTFNRTLTGLPNRNTTGSSVASLLMGSPASYRAASPPVVDRSSWYLSGFVQDDWQAHRDLVINVGVRWEIDTPFRTKDDIMNGFDLFEMNPVSKTPGVVKFAGIDGFPTTPHEIDWNNFGPRVGFAWRPFGSSRTVVRAAYGIFFAGPYDGAEAVTSLTTGYGTSLVIPTDDSGAPVSFRLSDPIPVVAVTDKLDSSFGAVPVGTTPFTEVRFYERDRATGYSQQMNFRVQHQLPGSLAVEAGYLGNLSRKMPGPGLSLNQIHPSLLGPGTAVQNRARRPFPQFSNVLVEGPTIGVINYHAFALKAEKRFTHGFNLLTTYTWSKNLDNTDSIQGLGTKAARTRISTTGARTTGRR